MIIQEDSDSDGPEREALFMGPSATLCQRSEHRAIDAAARMRQALDEIHRLGLGPVAVYGAGRHTAKVISALLDAPVEIAGFVDDSPSRQVAGVCGWPVVSCADLPSLRVRALVLNTDRYEAALWAAGGI
jgi:FlaA1/EpsC-like NDP-sugar epimerase